MQKLCTIALALLISTSPYVTQARDAAQVILVCKGKSHVKDPSGQVLGRDDDQVWKMTIDVAAKTLVFYPSPGSRGERGRFYGDGDVKGITMEADSERDKDSPFERISGSINTITGQFDIEIPFLAVKPPTSFEYSGICERAKPLGGPRAKPSHSNLFRGWGAASKPATAPPSY